MEVHHHPHLSHSDSESNRKKKFKEYLAEFLMIFLAVTLGFFAESIREHFVNKNIEKEYIHSLIEDLKSDLSQFDKTIALNVADLKNIDGSIHLLNAPVITDSISRALYYSHRTNPYFGTLHFNMRTITQLKSAGGFRLISNQQVSDSIVKYNNEIEWLSWLREELLSALKNDRESGFHIFNDYLMDSYQEDSLQTHSRPQLKLLTADKSILIPYANKLKMRYDWLNSYRANLVTMKRQCNNLIRLIKEKYDMREE